MIEFTAVIEDSIFNYRVVACIDESEGYANPIQIFFGDDPLTARQALHFINGYGVSDLSDEILTQYRREARLQAVDLAGLEWETKQIEMMVV